MFNTAKNDLPKLNIIRQILVIVAICRLLLPLYDTQKNIFISLYWQWRFTDSLCGSIKKFHFSNYWVVVKTEPLIKIQIGSNGAY
jgi:hypothetical protein